MKKALIVLFFLLFCFPSYVFAQDYSNVTLGKLQEGSLKLVYEDAIIPTYKAYDANYILISDLKYLGCNVIYSPEDKSISISVPLYGDALPESHINLISEPFSLYNGLVQVDYFETQSLLCNGNTLIPLAALGNVGTLSIIDSTCTFIPSNAVPVDTTQTTISNLSDLSLNVSILDIYWNGEAILTPSSYTLEPYAILERPLPVTDDHTLYLATLVQSATGENYTFVSNSYLGQLNTPLMKKYTRYSTRAALEDYGDITSLDEIIKAEDFVNAKGLSSPTPYLVWTNIDTQRTYIFQGSTNNWKLLKSFICSTGRDYTPTPKGTFALTYKVSSFGQNKGYCCKYAFGFIGTTYLYHSIIFDKSGTYLLENKGILGKKASQGCIRFDVENAKWFYDTLSSGTTVYIN
ncbi:MAG: L,D-transpeptidase [Cellulosilyticum sp.]|nr:L,D-transpeptidase [Cellulosilyticum sp.]